jgi:lactoylglutathione lyase
MMRPILAIWNAGGKIMTRGKVGTVALGHIGLTVSDLDVSEGFYQEVLGLRVVDESLQFPSRYASMARDGKTVLTLWEHSGGPIKKRRPGLHHVAFEADSVEEVNRTKGLLNNLGAHWTEGAKIYPEGSRAAAIHFEDPDGIRIELYSDDRADAALEEGARISLTTRSLGDTAPEISAAECTGLT